MSPQPAAPAGVDPRIHKTRVTKQALVKRVTMLIHDVRSTVIQVLLDELNTYSLKQKMAFNEAEQDHYHRLIGSCSLITSRLDKLSSGIRRKTLKQKQFVRDIHSISDTISEFNTLLSQLSTTGNTNSYLVNKKGLDQSALNVPTTSLKTKTSW